MHRRKAPELAVPSFAAWRWWHAVAPFRSAVSPGAPEHVAGATVVDPAAEHEKVVGEAVQGFLGPPGLPPRSRGRPPHTPLPPGPPAGRGGSPRGGPRRGYRSGSAVPSSIPGTSGGPAASASRAARAPEPA